MFFNYMGCAYCGNTVAWRWFFSNHWHRIIDGPCPCKPQIVIPNHTINEKLTTTQESVYKTRNEKDVS